MTDDTDPPWVIKLTGESPEPDFADVIEKAAQSEQPVVAVEITESYHLDRSGLAEITEKALEEGVELRIKRPSE